MALMHRKQNGTFYVCDATGNDRIELEYPQCTSNFEFHDAVREDFGIQPTQKIGVALGKKTAEDLLRVKKRYEQHGE